MAEQQKTGRPPVFVAILVIVVGLTGWALLFVSFQRLYEGDLWRAMCGVTGFLIASWVTQALWTGAKIK